jgi:hypothetical protein
MTDDLSASANVQDKAQIGLTPSGERFLDELMGMNWFLDRQDAYRVAIAVALARRLDPDPSEMVGIRTSYNFSGGVDRDGKLRQIIAALNPREAMRPAVFAERLAHAGLKFLNEKIIVDGWTLTDALDPEKTIPWN